MSDPIFCKRCGWVERAHTSEGLGEEEMPMLAGLVQKVCDEFVPPTIDEENS